MAFQSVLPKENRGRLGAPLAATLIQCMLFLSWLGPTAAEGQDQDESAEPANETARPQAGTDGPS